MTDIPEDVMKLARETALEIAAGVFGNGDARYVVEHGYKDIARALIADRAAQAERMARMEEALRRAACPRPCNGRPDDFEVGQCVDADECGCCLGDPLMKPADDSARALSLEGSDA